MKSQIEVKQIYKAYNITQYFNIQQEEDAILEDCTSKFLEKLILREESLSKQLDA